MIGGIAAGKTSFGERNAFMGKYAFRKLDVEVNP